MELPPILRNSQNHKFNLLKIKVESILPSPSKTDQSLSKTTIYIEFSFSEAGLRLSSS